VIRAVLHDEGRKPRFTPRVVCGLEMNGFSRYAVTRGSNLRDQVLCALYREALPVMRGRRSNSCSRHQDLRPLKNFHAEKLHGPESLLLRCCPTFALRAPNVMISCLENPTVGIPTSWLRVHAVPGEKIREAKLWHNSANGIDLMDFDYFRNYTTLVLAWPLDTLCLE